MEGKKTGCGVVRDLMPLYVDGAAGAESRALVEDHLEHCPACRRELEQMRGSVALPPEEDTGAVQSWKKEIRRRVGRRALVWAAAVLAVTAALALALSAVVTFGVPGWRLEQEDRKFGDLENAALVAKARNGDMAFFLYQEGSRLHYTYYENNPGLNFGYHFRASGSGHDEAGVYCVRHGDTVMVVSLNGQEDIVRVERTADGGKGAGTAYQVTPGEPFALLFPRLDTEEDADLRAFNSAGEAVPFAAAYVR